MLPPDGRSPIAIGFQWASRITAAGLAFALPMLAGHWVDRSLGSAPAGLLVGLGLGSILGLIQLIRVARDSSSSGN